MDLKSGLPYPLVRSGLLHTYPKLTQPINAQVVILGGGISGALTAYHLLNAGMDCVLIDGRSMGLGSSCASTSLLQYEIDVPLSKLQKKIGPKKAARAYELCGESILKLQRIASHIGFKDFCLKKSLFFAAEKSHLPFLKKEYLTRKRNHLAVSLLDSQEIESRFFFKAPGAILSDLGGQTDAYTFAHALHQYNLKKGCRIFDRTRIEQINHSTHKVKLVTDTGLHIQANYLVYATGYEAIKRIGKKIADLHSTFVTSSEHQSVNQSTYNDEAVIWNTANPYLYIRTTADGRFIVGGRDEKFSDAKRRDRLIDKKAHLLKKDFGRLFPDISFQEEFKWAGTFATTKDGLPFIGEYKSLPRGYFSLGFGGNGITFSLIAAEIVRDLLLGKRSPDAPLFSFDRI